VARSVGGLGSSLFAVAAACCARRPVHEPSDDAVYAVAGWLGRAVHGPFAHVVALQCVVYKPSNNALEPLLEYSGHLLSLIAGMLW
jgi:hypothetical protein